MPAQPALTFRPARGADRAAVVALIAGMSGHDEVAIDPAALRNFNAVIASPLARAIVAERDGTVAGYAEVQARSGTLENRDEAWLAALAVDARFRSEGIGAALLAHTEAQAALMGCTHIVLNSSLMRERAHEFYRREGFDEMRVARRFVRAIADRTAGGSLAQRFLRAAARAATRVERAIAGLGQRASVGTGADGAPTEAADAAAEAAALAVLRELDLPIVSEECGLVGRAVVESEPWISLDPLDGSRNFVEGYPSYGIAMGLVAHGAPVAGYVADLATGRRWWATRGAGAWCDGRPIRARRGTLVAMPSPLPGSTIRTPHDVARVRIAGSSALDLCRVADGSLAAFAVLERAVVHAHDLAGPLAVLLEAGATVLDRAGHTPRLIPDPVPTLTFVAAADEALARALLATSP